MQLLNSYEAAAQAAVLSRAGCVIGNNDITKSVARTKDFSCEIFDTNSEETAISAAVGRVLQGKRVMLTDLVWLKPAAHYRVPMVSISPGFRNWGLNLLPASAQEALEMVLVGYSWSEDRKVLLPVNVVIDRLGASTFEPVELPGQKIIDNMLGELKLEKYDKHMQYAGHDLEQSAQLAKAVENAYKAVPEFSQNWKKRFKKPFELVEKFQLEDAELAIVAYGSSSGNAKLAVQKLRQEGMKVGLLRIKSITPLPEKEIAEALKGAKRIAVVDRQVLTGAWSKLYYLVKAAHAGFTSNFITSDSMSVSDFVEIAKRLKSAEGPERIWLI